MKTNIILVYLLVISSITYSQTESKDIFWKDIQRISFDSATSVVPQVVISGDTVHIVWFGSYSNSLPDSGWGLIYSRSIDGGISFSPQKRIIHPESVAVFKHLSQHSAVQDKLS
jgi:hypothetical protein